MAANDYYTPPPRQDPTNPPSYQSYHPQQPPLQSLPSYHSQVPSQYPSTASPVSPFEEPFDDHVYPTGGLDGQHRMDSQSILGSESGYYRQGGGGRQDSSSLFREDIPLRDRPGALAMKKNMDANDHVYDANDLTAPHFIEEGRKKRRSRMDMIAKPRGRIPWVTYALTTAQVAVFIAEIAKNAILTGSPIEIHPQFNPMIGPSPYVQINMGGRYMPCMHNVVGIQDSVIEIGWSCPNSTSNGIGPCTLSELCGFNGVPNPLYNGDINQKPEPNQWFRFIIPMFLHAGIIHIGFNMLLQLTLGREMEISIGPVRYFIVYISSGIFGFVLGGNFAASGIVSTGASGCLFGIVALTLLDLLYTWRERVSPWKDFAFIALDVVISFVLGLLPGLDNFSHIGGFLMGLVLGICILRSPNALRARTDQDEPPYTPVTKASNGDRPDAGVTGFVKNPVGFFKGRRGAWWAWWLVRAASLAAVFIIFILLLNNFYVYRKTCSWCKYLSCININNWCNQGNIAVTTTNTTSKRSVLDSWDAMAKLYEV